MLKALLVDDEPFILQGLRVLVDWEKEGYEIATATSGQEALAYLSENTADLIIADIKMPEMSGLELLKNLREHQNDVNFVILSGFADFGFAQEALRYGCTDYILKPVEEKQLLDILRKTARLESEKASEICERRKQEKAYLDRNIMFLLSGKYDKSNLEYLRDKIDINSDMCFVDIFIDGHENEEEDSDEDMKGQLRKLYDSAQEFLKEDAKFCILDISDSEKVYDIGFIYTVGMGSRLQLTDEEYLEHFLDFLRNNTGIPVTMLVGKYVTGIFNISKSYGTANMLRSLRGLREPKKIYFYEKEYKVLDTRVLICKKELDSLIEAIELGEHVAIHKAVDVFYDAMKKNGAGEESVNLNINYLLFQLIHIASQQDSEVNQEEVLRIISEATAGEGTRPGSRQHICRMAYTYGEYLSQLKKHVSKPVLKSIEEEVRNNYASNLTLKEFSEKYYVNSAYLGQLFRKHFGCSFKDYLNKQRIEEAAKLLRKTDMKIYEVADAVGYRDVDYFVNKFIETKNCTPTKYKKTG